MKQGVKIALVGIGIFVIYNELQKRKKNPNIFVSNVITGKYNARTIPPFGIFVSEQQKDNQMLINHELVHWRQYQKLGLIKFYSHYNYYNNHLGYDANPMEIEARVLTGEKQECVNNYTECVRNGTALTVFNPQFRL